MGKLAEIARNFPACFTSSSILPILDAAIADGNSLTEQAKQKMPAITFTKTWGDIQDATNRVIALRDKFSKEPPATQYCNSDPATQAQHYQTIQVVSSVYQAASAVEGIYASSNMAWDQFKHDVNPLNYVPPIIPQLPVSSTIQWLLLGLGVLLVVNSFKKSSTVVVQSPTPAPPEPKP